MVLLSGPGQSESQTKLILTHTFPPVRWGSNCSGLNSFTAEHLHLCLWSSASTSGCWCTQGRQRGKGTDVSWSAFSFSIHTQPKLSWKSWCHCPVHQPAGCVGGTTPETELVSRVGKIGQPLLEIWGYFFTTKNKKNPKLAFWLELLAITLIKLLQSHLFFTGGVGKASIFVRYEKVSHQSCEIHLNKCY